MASTHRKGRYFRPVSRWAHLVKELYIKPPLIWIFRLRPVGVELIPRTGAGILVSNHVTLFDPVWIVAVLRRPIHFVATEELFRGRLLGGFITTYGAFPKRKAAQDTKTLRTMMEALSSGGLIGLYPEGVRTWDGSNGPLIPTIARLIRRFKVPVYSCRLHGGYLSAPRWAARWRRVPVRLQFDRLYRSEEIPDSEERILADIARAIETRDYGLPLDQLEGRRTGLAEGVEKILYRCPECQSLESLEPTRPTAANLVQCSVCFSTWRVDLSSRLTPVNELRAPIAAAQTVAELYRRVKAMPLRPIRSTLARLEEGEELYLVSRPHLMYRQRRFPRLRLFGYGRVYLSDRRLVFRGRRKGRGRIRLSAPLEQLESLSIEPGDKLHFIYQGLLYRIPFRGESPLKWMDAIERLQVRRQSLVGA